jgi:hypothetical protein
MRRTRVPASSNASQLESVQVEQMIRVVRGRKVMLDFDLARLYGVTTRRLNEQVRRNLDRFPEDFLFRLTPRESEVIRSQIATAWPGRRNIRFGPWAPRVGFTREDREPDPSLGPPGNHQDQS